MSLRLAPEDRKLAIGFAILLVVALALAGYAIKSDGGGGAKPSSYSAGNSGTKAAFLLLEQTGYSPRRWTDNPQRLSQAGLHATLIMAEPQASDEEDAEAVRQFVRKGGRVLITGLTGAEFFPTHRTAPGTPHFEWQEYSPSEPSDLTRGIAVIKMAPMFNFPENAKSDTPFVGKELSEHPIVRFSYGAGEVIWWSASDPMSNSGIRQRDNAQLLLNCVGEAGSGPVLWDEYFHEGGKTVVDSVLESPLKWGLLQVGLIGVIVCFTYSRRFGPVRQSVAVSRLAPMEFVETLAALYERSKASHIAVEIVYERFRGALHRRYSIRVNAPAEQVAASISDHLRGSDPAAISKSVNEIENAISDPSLKMDKATALVNQMQQWSKSLKLGWGE